MENSGEKKKSSSSFVRSAPRIPLCLSVPPFEKNDLDTNHAITIPSRKMKFAYLQQEYEIGKIR